MKNILEEMIDFEKLNNSSMIITKKNGEKILIKNINDDFLKNCYKILRKKCTVPTIKRKHKKNCAATWTDRQINFLKKNYKKDLDILSEKLKKSKYQICFMKGKLNLIERATWTEKEVEYLKENLDVSNFILSEKLNRTIHSIKSKKKSILLKIKEG